MGCLSSEHNALTVNAKEYTGSVSGTPDDETTTFNEYLWRDGALLSTIEIDVNNDGVIDSNDAQRTRHIYDYRGNISQAIVSDGRSGRIPLNLNASSAYLYSVNHK